MPERVAILDYGLGNLYSVRQACQRVGLMATITSSKRMILASDGVVLPGVGAMGDAIAGLERLDLVTVIRRTVDAGKQHPPRPP